MTDFDERLTYAPFARPDAEQIRSAIVAAQRPLLCPRCSSQLETGAPIVGGGAAGTFWLVRCTSCRRSLRVTELPEPGS